MSDRQVDFVSPRLEEMARRAGIELRKGKDNPPPRMIPIGTIVEVESGIKQSSFWFGALCGGAGMLLALMLTGLVVGKFLV